MFETAARIGACGRKTMDNKSKCPVGALSPSQQLLSCRDVASILLNFYLTIGNGMASEI